MIKVVLGGGCIERKRRLNVLVRAGDENVPSVIVGSRAAHSLVLEGWI